MRRRLGACVAQYTSPHPTSPQFLRDLDAAVELGMWGVRLDIAPCYTACGTQLEQPAAKIAAARARGLLVHAVLPHWLTTDKVQHKDGASLAALGQHAARVAGELGDQIDAVELGNEPDLADPFAPDGVDPEYQAAVSAAMVRNLPRGMRICSPGLAPASDTTKGGKVTSMAPATFARRYWTALDVKTKRRIDGHGLHLYGTPKDIAQPWSTYHQLPDIVAAGAGRPLEITECNGDVRQPPAVMAVQCADALSWLSSTSIAIGRVFIYELSTQGSEPTYGAFDADGAAQPLLATLQRWKDRP